LQEKSPYNRDIGSPCLNLFSQQLAGLEVDKYAKKLKTQQLIELVAHAQLKQQKSLRDISNSFNEDEFSQAINLDSTSASQISRRLRDLPPKAVQLLLKSNILEISKEIGFDAITRKIGRICPENNFCVAPRWFPPFASQFFSRSKKFTFACRLSPAAGWYSTP